MTRFVIVGNSLPQCFLHPLRDRAMDTTHPYNNYCFVFHLVHTCWSVGGGGSYKSGPRSSYGITGVGERNHSHIQTILTRTIPDLSGTDEIITFSISFSLYAKNWYHTITGNNTSTRLVKYWY